MPPPPPPLAMIMIIDSMTFFLAFPYSYPLLEGCSESTEQPGDLDSPDQQKEGGRGEPSPAEKHAGECRGKCRWVLELVKPVEVLCVL